MNRRWWTLLAAICAAGFFMRAAIGIFDARRPIFPSNYYNDERDYVDAASLLIEGRLDARRTALTPGKEIYTRWLALLARGFGPGPLPGRLTNAAAGGLTSGLWGWSTAVLTTPATGLAAAAFVAAWPSHNFHTSMAIKEAPISLLLALCVATLFAGLAVDGRRRNLWFATAAAAALGLSLLRAYLLPILALSVAVSAVRPERSARRAAFAALLWFVLAIAASLPLRRALQEPAQAPPTPPSATLPALEAAFGEPLFGLAARRRTLIEGSRIWSFRQFGRAPESLLFPDQALNTWLDLALFLPKACLYELFMPLPGLYPTDGKPGRVLASAEGAVLLIVFATAAWGLRKLTWGPQPVFLASFFILAVLPTAFFEYDLGSASRHRIHFFPFLLPFAGASLRIGRPKP